MRSVRSSISRISSCSPLRDSNSMRMRSSTVSFAIVSGSSTAPFGRSSFFLRFSVRGAASFLPVRISVIRLRFSSLRIRISSLRFFSIRPTCSCSICRARPSFSTPLRQKILTSTTVPSIPGGVVREASRTSPDFSPKMARSSFSSGVSCVSPLGVTLPIRMSPGRTGAPIRMMPDSSRSLRKSSETLGMSLVISSGPSLVSRASISNSSIWIEVK